jgi:predicted XRE-type DNA-binding protein
MSALTFRNLDVSPDQPVSEWPLEAIQTALERGGLSDWHRLAGEIREQPWGLVARSVEETLTYSKPYGVATLMERVIAAARNAAETAERQTVATEVTRLIQKSGLSQAEFASLIGTSASRLSTYATGKVTPSAALLVRMRRAGGPSGHRCAES